MEGNVFKSRSTRHSCDNFNSLISCQISSAFERFPQIFFHLWHCLWSYAHFTEIDIHQIQNGGSRWYHSLNYIKYIIHRISIARHFVFGRWWNMLARDQGIVTNGMVPFIPRIRWMAILVKWVYDYVFWSKVSKVVTVEDLFVKFV